MDRNNGPVGTGPLPRENVEPISSHLERLGEHGRRMDGVPVPRTDRRQANRYGNFGSYARHGRRPLRSGATVWGMTSEPDLTQLQRLAADRGQVIIKAPDDDLYALVKPDNAGKGTDPRGELGAALAFRDGVGMPLADVADLLEGRAS